MKTFRVIYKEVLLHEFYIDAETESEVDNKFVKMAEERELDFSRGEVYYSDIVNIEDLTIQN